MVDSVILGATVKSTLTSIQRSREAVDRTSERLATGLKVNRATDQPQNFFTASALNHNANLFNGLLDKMGLGVQTIQQALTGIETIENILNLAELKALEAKEELEKTGNALPNTILADNPVGYFRLDDADLPIAENEGSLGAGHLSTYENGVSQSSEISFYGAGGLSAKFDGNGQFIAVPVDDSINTLGPYDQKTIELVFNAETVSGRQVLFEEGGPVNNLSIYIDEGQIYVNGRTRYNGGASTYGPFNISTPIEAGTTYTVALVQDATNNSFSGFLNGEEFGSEFIGVPINSHPNRNAIGAIDQDVYFHDDGPGNAPNRPAGSFAFNGEISHVAFYNDALSQDQLRARYEATSLPISEKFRQETQDFLTQLQGVVDDTHFRGINLLNKENLVVDFNNDKTSRLEVEGTGFSIESLNLDNINFQRPSQVEAAISNIREAIAQVRDFGFKLANDITIIQTRQDFTRNIINTFESGASDLIIADQNEEGANLLAAQTRLGLSTTSLSLASQSQASILTIFNTTSVFS